MIPTFPQNLLDEVWTSGLSPSAPCTAAPIPALQGALPPTVLHPQWSFSQEAISWFCPSPPPLDSLTFL